VALLFAPVSIPPASNEASETASEVADIQRTLKQLETSVNKLHGSRRKFKSGFNANVAFISNKFSEINDKFAEVDAEYNVLCDQVEELQHGDLPDLARQIEDLNERVCGIVADRDEEFHTSEAQSADFRSCVELLNNLADEMRAFLVTSQKEFSHHLNDMRAAREETVKTMSEAKAIIASAPTVGSSLREVQVSPLAVSRKQVRVHPGC
jgi:chromosome segregation ATPase